MKKAIIVLCAATALFGCGKKEGKFNEAQAKEVASSNIDTTVTLNSSTSDTAGESAAAQFQATSQSAGASIITPVAMLPALLGKSGAFAAGTRECSNKKCTFQDYSNSSESGALTINGAIDWSGGNIKTGPDLTYKLSTGGLEWSTTLRINLTVTETSINGTIDSSGKGTVEGTAGLPGIGGAGAGWEYASKIEYKAVTLAGGKPTGGSVVVTADYTVGGQAYTGNGTINYP